MVYNVDIGKQKNMASKIQCCEGVPIKFPQLTIPIKILRC